MRTPNNQEITAFFHGYDTAIKTGEKHRRGGSSYILNKQRGERAALKIMHDLKNIQTERGTRPAAHPNPKTPSAAVFRTIVEFLAFFSFIAAMGVFFLVVLP